MPAAGYPHRRFTSLYCRIRVRFTLCLKLQHSCRSLLAGALHYPGVIQFAQVCRTWGVIRSNVMLKALAYEPSRHSVRLGRH